MTEDVGRTSRLTRILGTYLRPQSGPVRLLMDRASRQKTHKPCPPKRPFGFMGGPFTRDDFGPTPADWDVRPPDFVGAGVPKAGTSWWYSLMTQHPKVAHHRLFDPERPQATKELHYFVHFGWKEMTGAQVGLYREAFAAPPGGVSGEWSVLYLCHPGCVSQLAQAVPRTRIVIMLRNPIDRLLSHLDHLMRHRSRVLHVRPDWGHFFEVFSACPEATLHSQYGGALERLLLHFPREQVLALQYERCTLTPEDQLARTFRFLGVDDDFTPSNLRAAVNRHDHVLAPPNPSERSRLAEYFSADVQTTAVLFPEIDVALWPDFHHG
jgi:hypothetical protein